MIFIKSGRTRAVLLDLVLPEFHQIRREKFEFWEKSFGNLVPHDEMTLWLNFHVIWWARTQDWFWIEEVRVGKVRGCSSRFWKSASGPTARFFGPTARRQFFARFWSVGGQTATHLSQTAVAHGQTMRSPEPRWFWTLDGRTAKRSGRPPESLRSDR